MDINIMLSEAFNKKCSEMECLIYKLKGIKQVIEMKPGEYFLKVMF